jgi:hypothetical protein
MYGFLLPGEEEVGALQARHLLLTHSNWIFKNINIRRNFFFKMACYSVLKTLGQWFPNFFWPPPPWFHKYIPSAPSPYSIKCILQNISHTTH